MADSRLEEIFGREINTAKELRQGIIELQNSVKDLGTSEEALQKGTSDLVYAQEEYNKMINSAKQSTDFAKDSVMGMEKEYKNLYNTYKMLTEEQRNSDFGKNMAESLNTLSNKLNESKKDVGNYKDNIGRYSQGVMDAFSQMGVSVGALQGPMKLAAGGAKTLGASLKSLIANPVGAVIMAIVVAFKALSAIVDRVREAINSNEESQMRLKEAMSAFQPIIDGVKNAFDWLGQKVVDVIDFISKAVTTVRSAIAAFTDFIGITDGAKDAIDKQTEAYSELAKSQNEYIKRQREIKVLNAKDTAKVEELREQAAETEDNTEKLKLLNEAKDIQAQIDARNLELAEENLRILQAEAAMTANDAEANDKLADALAAVEQARANGDRNARTFTKQINTLTKSTKGHTDVLAKEKEEVQKILDTLADNAKTEIQKLTDKYNKEKALLEKYHKDTTELTKQYNDKIEAINKEKEKNELTARKAINDKLHQFADDEMQLNYALSDAKSIDNRLAEMKNSLGGLSLDEQSEKVKEFKEEIKDLVGLEINSIDDFQKILEISSKSVAQSQSNLNNYKKNKNNSDNAKSSGQGIADAEYSALMEKLQNGFKEGSLEYYQVINDAEDALLQKKIEIKQIELENFKGTEEEKLSIKMEILELQNEAVEKQMESETALFNLQKERNANLLADTKSSLGGLSSLVSGLQTLTKAQVENGKLDEKEKKKKEQRLKNLQALETAVAVTSVAVDTASAIMGIWRGYSLEKVANAETAAATGPAAAATLAALNTKSLISAIVQTAGIAATGIGQLSAIAGNHISGMASIGDSSDGGSATATPTATIDSTPYSYTRQLQTEEEEEEFNKPIYVSVTDINNVQNKVQVRENESTF